MKIILLGAPGTGKGTQSIILSQIFQIPHIATGDMFRKHFKEKTVLGELAKKFIAQGLLVPDEITNKMIIERLSQKDIDKGFILDGFPRNLSQAKLLKKFFQEKNFTLTAVIYLNTSPKCLEKRITGRRICSECGEIYHIETKPPHLAGYCDKEGALLKQRKDDRKETFLKRLEVYQKETFPLVEYYRNQKFFVEISVNDIKTSIQEVTDLILKALANFK